MFYPTANVLCLLVILGQPGPLATDNPVSKQQDVVPHILKKFDGKQRISSPPEITPPQVRWALSENVAENASVIVDQDANDQSPLEIQGQDVPVEPPKATPTNDAPSSQLTFDRPGDQQGLNSKEKFPPILESSLNRGVYRDVTPKLVTLKSDDFQHRHLLFDEVDFERHGVGHASKSRQFLESTARFFGRGLLLPATTLRGKPWKWQVAPGK